MSEPRCCSFCLICPLASEILYPAPSSADVGVKLSIDAVTQAVTLELKIAA